MNALYGNRPNINPPAVMVNGVLLNQQRDDLLGDVNRESVDDERGAREEELEVAEEERRDEVCEDESNAVADRGECSLSLINDDDDSDHSTESLISHRS